MTPPDWTRIYESLLAAVVLWFLLMLVVGVIIELME